MKGNGLEVGPILMGMGNRAHIVTPRDHGAWASEHLGARGNAGQPLRLAGRLSRAEGDSARRGSKPYLPGLPPPAAFFGAGFLSPI
jgi:hypothetical protein